LPACNASPSDLKSWARCCQALCTFGSYWLREDKILETDILFLLSFWEPASASRAILSLNAEHTSCRPFALVRSPISASIRARLLPAEWSSLPMGRCKQTARKARTLGQGVMLGGWLRPPAAPRQCSVSGCRLQLWGAQARDLCGPQRGQNQRH